MKEARVSEEIGTYVGKVMQTLREKMEFITIMTYLEDLKTGRTKIL